MHGIYRIYKNDELVIESNNLITTNGKSIIHQYLAGAISEWASILSIGASSSSVTVSDYKMSYDIANLPISSRIATDSSSVSTTISGTSGQNTVTVGASAGLAVGYSLEGTGINASATVTITSIAGTTITLSHPNSSTVSGTGIFRSPRSVKFKTTIPQGIDCIIYEVGISNNTSPNGGVYDFKILSNFDEGVGSSGWTAGTASSSYASYSPRLSNQLLNLVATTSSQRTVLGTTSSAIAIGSASSPAGNLLIDTTPYANGFDTAKLLVYSTGTASITIKAQDDSTLNSASPDNFITLFSSASVGSGVNLIEATISKGSLYNDNLSKIEISYVCGSGSVNLYLDSLKFSYSNNTNIYSGLVSRSVLSSPITKTAQETVDIEYEIYLYP